MGRMYACVFEGVAVTAAQDLFEINSDSTSDSVVVLHSVTITQSSDAGDSEAEMLPVLIHRGSTAGSGGTSAIVCHPFEVGSPAFGGVVDTNHTTQSTDGEELHRESFNVQAGFFYRPTPEERIVIPPNDRLVVALEAAPSDSLTMDGTAIIEEIG
jgi:hypothetical protein